MHLSVGNIPLPELLKHLKGGMQRADNLTLSVCFYLLFPSAVNLRLAVADSISDKHHELNTKFRTYILTISFYFSIYL